LAAGKGSGSFLMPAWGVGGAKARDPDSKSLFASFSSEKEGSFLC
jgi:hypothetical protein